MLYVETKVDLKEVKNRIVVSIVCEGCGGGRDRQKMDNECSWVREITSNAL
jgi:hypothetical protein